MSDKWNAETEVTPERNFRRKERSMSIENGTCIENSMWKRLSERAACRTESVSVRALCMLWCMSLIAGVLLTEAQAQTAAPRIAFPSATVTLPTFSIANSKVLAKAPEDACYYGIGNNLIADDGYGGVPVQADNCIRIADGQTKVNQAYVWGLTSAGSGGSDIWFGTMSNTLCTVQGAMLGLSGSAYTTPDNAWVCEFGSSAWDTPVFGGVAAAGDLRPARIYWYNSSSGLHDVTPGVPPTTHAGWLPTNVYPLLLATAGLRSAATLPGSLSGNPSGTPDMVVLAGPALETALGINLFVFNATTHAYIGSFSLPQYSDIRKYVTYQGITGSGIYAAVANSASNPNSATAGGSVLLYSGVQDYPHCHNCPAFKLVGLLPSEGAYIASHLGRLYVTTWPGKVNGVYKYASLVMGPTMPTNGKLPASTSLWASLWQATDYEPDPVIAATYGGGALQSFGGQLYWGTMHVPFEATVAAWQTYGAPTSSTATATLLAATQRAAAVFRGTNLGMARADIDLLYGEALLTQYHVASQTWAIVPNNMHAKPMFGTSGMGNPFNNYIWSMAVWNNRLWVGTMNWAYVFNEVAPQVEEVLGLTPGSIDLGALGLGTIIPFGANLAYFNNAFSPARFDDDSGLGNYLNYGIRNLLPAGNVLYVGTANPMNLKTDPSKDKLGGWELIQLKLKPGY
ncbi:MAG: hypothetical protein WCD04_15635 [Terriglobia bacterium]|jgi:hypothetical protein